MTDACLYHAENGIAVITLNRPHRLNAFNGDVFAGLTHGLDLAERDDSIRAVMITGAGRAFSAGQDLQGDLPGGDDGRIDLGLALERNYNPLALRLVDCPKIIVAALNGPAVGAAANLALACDIIVAAQSAYLQQAFVRIGLIPDAGGTWLLPRMIGSKLALALALTGDRMDADEAKSMGLVYRVFPDDTFMSDAQAFMAPFATGPATAYGLIKQAFRSAGTADFSAQLQTEADLQSIAGRTDDFQGAVRAFAEKRPPVFTGR